MRLFSMMILLGLAASILANPQNIDSPSSLEKRKGRTGRMHATPKSSSAQKLHQPPHDIATTATLLLVICMLQ